MAPVSYQSASKLLLSLSLWDNLTPQSKAFQAGDLSEIRVVSCEKANDKDKWEKLRKSDSNAVYLGWSEGPIWHQAAATGARKCPSILSLSHSHTDTLTHTFACTHCSGRDCFYKKATGFCTNKTRDQSRNSAPLPCSPEDAPWRGWYWGICARWLMDLDLLHIV